MFVVEKKFRFEASHVLPFHDGKCKRMHGHSWNGTVGVYGPQLIETGPKRGMVMDFGLLGAIINKPVEDYLDHYHLNDTLHHFGIVNPTSEEVARWMFRRLADQIQALAYVRIEETCTTSATYFGGADHQEWLARVKPPTPDIQQTQTTSRTASQVSLNLHQPPGAETFGSK